MALYKFRIIIIIIIIIILLLAYIFWYFVPFSTTVAVFDILRYDVLTLQNVLPVYYSLQRDWQPNKLSLLTRVSDKLFPKIVEARE